MNIQRMNHKQKLRRLGKLTGTPTDKLTEAEKDESEALFKWFEADRRRRNLGGKVVYDTDGKTVCLSDVKRQARIVRALTWQKGKLKPLAKARTNHIKAIKSGQTRRRKKETTYIKERSKFIRQEYAKLGADLLEKEKYPILCTKLRNRYNDELHANKYLAERTDKALYSIINRALGKME